MSDAPHHARATVVDTPEGIEMFRLLAIRGRLDLEARGIRFRVPTGPAARKILTDAGRRAPRSRAALAIEFRSYVDSILADVTSDPA